MISMQGKTVIKKSKIKEKLYVCKSFHLWIVLLLVDIQVVEEYIDRQTVMGTIIWKHCFHWGYPRQQSFCWFKPCKTVKPGNDPSEDKELCVRRKIAGEFNVVDTFTIFHCILQVAHLLILPSRMTVQPEEVKDLIYLSMSRNETNWRNENWNVFFNQIVIWYNSKLS